MTGGRHNGETGFENPGETMIGSGQMSLTLTGTDAYPTGYVRYTTTEERRMLNQMAEDYDVDPVYVLDMYRHGKVNWMLDLGQRLAVVLVVYVGAVAATACFKSRKKIDS